jgi:hypothetical protein
MSLYFNVSFIGKILPDDEFFSRILNFGKKSSPKVFLIAKISSNLTIFHPFEQIFIHL